MRVIAGKAKGIQLKTPEGMLTRPTTDRVKEALFSILQFDLPGTRVFPFSAREDDEGNPFRSLPGQKQEIIRERTNPLYPHSMLNS